MIYGYVRFSTNQQDCENQKLGIDNRAKQLGCTVDKYIEDAGVSGTVKAKNRNLWQIVKNGKAGDLVITSELSRLGRSTIDVLETCNVLSSKGIDVWFVKQGIGLDQSPMGKMMIAIMSAFAEMERDLISLRTKESLARLKKDGKRLGRKPGTLNKKHKLDGKDKVIKKMLNEGLNRNQISKKLHVSFYTLNNFMKNKSIFFEIIEPLFQKRIQA